MSTPGTIPEYATDGSIMPTAEQDELFSPSIMEAMDADPKLQQVMLALIRTKRQSDLGSLLDNRRSLQELIDSNILVAGPLISPTVQATRKKILKHLRETQLNSFLETRPSFMEIAEQNLVKDTMTWARVIQAGTLPLARNCHTLTVVDDRIFLFGGIGSTTRAGDMFVFDTETMGWSRPLVAGMLPLERYSHTVVAFESQLVLFGGFSYQEQYLNDVFIVDTALNQTFHPTWPKNHEEMPEVTMLMWIESNKSIEKPAPRAAHTAVAVGNLMYVFGGNDGNRLFNDLHVFNIDTWQWSSPMTSGDTPPPRAGHTATVVADDFMLVFGGGTVDGPSNDLYKLNLSTLVWTKMDVLGTPPRPRIGHTAAIVLCNKLLIFGGGSYDKVYDDLHIFDLSSSSWYRPSDTGSVPVPRAGHSCCAIGSRLYIYGGSNIEGDIFNDLHTLDCAFIHLQEVLGKREVQPVRRYTTEELKSPEMEPALDLQQAAYRKIDLCKSRITSTVEAIQGDINKRDKQYQGQINRVKDMLNNLEKQNQGHFEELNEQVSALEYILMEELDSLKSKFTLKQPKNNSY